MTGKRRPFALGTRGIIWLLIISLSLQVFAVLGLIWERRERVNPALEQALANRIADFVESRVFETREGPAPQAGRERAQLRRGLVFVPLSVLERKDLEPRRRDALLPLLQQRFDADTGPLYDIQAVRVELDRDDLADLRPRSGRLPQEQFGRHDHPKRSHYKDEDLHLDGFLFQPLASPLGQSFVVLLTFDRPVGLDFPVLPLVFIVTLVFLPMLIALLALVRLRRSTLALGQAAHRFGTDLHAPALAVQGPREVQDTALAFNAMQGRIRDLIAERTRMLAAISHDLRTQLTKLRLRAEFISPEQQRDKAISDIARLDSLLGQVVQFARADAGSDSISGAPATLSTEELDLSALVTSLAQDMGWMSRLQLSLPPQLPIRSNKAALERIISNLVENALRYGDESGAVQISLVPQSEQRFCLTVRDRGPGIAEDQLTRVLEPFYRLESSRNRDTGGSGLGLAIVASLARQLGYTLELRNHPQGGLEAEISGPLLG